MENNEKYTQLENENKKLKALVNGLQQNNIFLNNLKQALEEMSIVSTTDAKGNIKYANDKFCEISQYTREELIGENHRIIKSGVHSNEYYKQLWETISKGEVWKGEVCNRAKDGTLYWVDVMIKPVLDNNLKPIEYIAIRTPITEKKQAIEQLLKANELLELASNDENTEQNIIKTLKIVGEVVKAKKITIYENYMSLDTRELSFRTKYQWSSDKINEKFFSAEYKKGYSQLKKNLLKCNDFELYSKSNYELINILNDSIKSVFILPLFIYKTLWGFATIESDSESIYTDSEKSHIKMVMNTILSVLQRQTALAKYAIAKELFENYKGFVGIISGNGNVFINKSGKQMLGIKEYETIPSYAIDAIFPEWAKQKYYKENSGCWNNYTEIITKTKEKIPVFQTVLIKDENNFYSERFIASVANDITEIRKNEELIVKNQAILKAIIDSIPDIIFQIDENGIFLDVKTHDNALKLPYSGKSIKDIFPDKIWIPSLETIKKVKEKGGVELFEYELSLFNLDKHYFEARVTQSTIGNYLFIIRDITKRKNSEKELIKAKHAAEEAALAKQNFLSTMSHEIRTPMNAVIGITHLLLQEEPKPEQLENLKTLQFSAQNLMGIINDVLDFSKIEAGKIVFEEIDFNLKEILNGVHRSLQFKAIEKNIDFVWDWDEEIPEIVIGDSVRLTQILNNLTGNALKFTHKGFVKISAQLNKSLSQEKLITIDFNIEDTGTGIPKDKIDLVFEKFTQASEDTTRKYGGTGLGLSITKKLLELQNSEIKVKSELGKGTTFYFSLQFRKSSLKKIDNNSETFEIKDLSHLKILIAEDNEMNQMVVNKFLKKWNIRPDFAINGQEAVEKANLQNYDIILMDLQMPEVDGFEATKRIRSLGGHFKNIPIIALTASSLIDVKDKIYSTGMNDFIPKPFNPTILYEKIVKYGLKSEVTEATENIILDSKENDNLSLYNYETILDLADGNVDFLQEFIGKLVKSLEEFREQYVKSMQSVNLENLRFHHHKIKSSLEMFEMNQLSENIQKSKTLISVTTMDIDEYKVLYIDTLNIIDKTISSLQNKLLV